MICPKNAKNLKKISATFSMSLKQSAQSASHRRQNVFARHGGPTGLGPGCLPVTCGQATGFQGGATVIPEGNRMVRSHGPVKWRAIPVVQTIGAGCASLVVANDQKEGKSDFPGYMRPRGCARLQNHTRDPASACRLRAQHNRQPRAPAPRGWRSLRIFFQKQIVFTAGRTPKAHDSKPFPRHPQGAPKNCQKSSKRRLPWPNNMLKPAHFRGSKLLRRRPKRRFTLSL